MKIKWPNMWDLDFQDRMNEICNDLLAEFDLLTVSKEDVVKGILRKMNGRMNPQVIADRYEAKRKIVLELTTGISLQDL